MIDIGKSPNVTIRRHAMPSIASSFSQYCVPRSAFGWEGKAMRWTTIATMTLGTIVER
mgnify:FL=1